MNLVPTERVKTNVLIKRRHGVSHEELVVHWFKNHMPRVIDGQVRAGSDRGANKYIAQLFSPSLNKELPWDGVAQLWVKDAPQPSGQSLSGRPTDTFQEKCEPYHAWHTREYVIVDGSEHLSTEPLTLDPAYPSTRAGFLRVNYLVPAIEGTDYEEFYSHWLEVHVPNIKSRLTEANGFRYVVNHSIYPEHSPYAGMAELYFHQLEDWHKCRSLMQADGMERYVDSSRMDVLLGETEMIGIP